MSARVATYFPFNVTCYLQRPLVRRPGAQACWDPIPQIRQRVPGVADVQALQTAADRLSGAILQRRCTYWVRRLVPTFSSVECAALQPGYRFGMAQMAVATDIVFKRSEPLTALFQRACELGVRWYYQTSFAKNYTRSDHHGDRILRVETCSNDTRHFGVGRRLENLPLLRDKLAATDERTVALQADLMASTVDIGQPKVGCNASAARGVIVSPRLAPSFGVLLLKLRVRLLGPLATLATHSNSHRPYFTPTPSTLLHEVDTALDHLCAALGLQRAA
jgi:hypothetical protein